MLNQGVGTPKTFLGYLGVIKIEFSPFVDDVRLCMYVCVAFDRCL